MNPIGDLNLVLAQEHMLDSASSQIQIGMSASRHAGELRRSQFRAKWKSQLNQNEEVGVHSSAIVASGMGIRRNESPVAGGVSITGDSAQIVEVFTMLSLKVNRKT